MIVNNRATQRIQIQEVVNEYFERNIDISPRAMAALQGRWCDKDREKDLPDFTPALSIFEGLITSSPSCLLLLSEFIVAPESLFSKGFDEKAAPLFFDTLGSIFEGNPDRYYWKDLCPTGEKVRKKGTLTELDLLSAFLETAYIGPKFFFENVDTGLIATYCTDVGDRLLNSASIDPSSVIEMGDDHWDEGIQREFDAEFGDIFSDHPPERYIARSLAEKFFYSLNRRVEGILIADPSHDRFQFALWQDEKGMTHLTPFGVGKLGSLAPSYQELGQEFVLREGIFQPLSAILPGYKDEAIFQLEDLINSKSADESDFQMFFKFNPELLAGFDYSTIHPQLVLYSDEGHDLIPDFMLEPMSSKFCDLLELKLPYQTLVTRLRNKSRVRFKAAINQAISQLIEYRRYFESKENRRAFHKQYGLEAYNPKMILVVGRAHHFMSDLERLELQSLLPRDFQIWTYDDLLSRAKLYRRLVSKHE